MPTRTRVSPLAKLRPPPKLCHLDDAGSCVDLPTPFELSLLVNDAGLFQSFESRRLCVVAVAVGLASGPGGGGAVLAAAEVSDDVEGVEIGLTPRERSGSIATKVGGSGVGFKGGTERGSLIYEPLTNPRQWS